jgi:tellurite resistance protein TehA-like permease
VVAPRIERLHPAYFALVMATGVVTLACQFLGLPVPAARLVWLNVFLAVVLCGLTVLRVLWFPRAFFGDWGDHQRGVGFFTIVAATSVVGTEFAVLRHDLATATVLFWAALILWAICTYAIFTALTVRQSKPSLADGINGGWLTAVVATQSLTVLGCQVVPKVGAHSELALMACLAFWLCGGMLYIWTISLIFYRYTFFRFLPSDLMPPYWINMGAMAISTLAGTALLRRAPDSELLRSMEPFLRGFTMLYWATATWWIPMLVILAIWRHAIRRFPLRYDPLYWGAVFPLGMYTTCTYHLAKVFHLDFLLPVPRIFVLLAVAAWSVTFGGLLWRLASIAQQVQGSVRER